MMARIRVESGIRSNTRGNTPESIKKIYVFSLLLEKERVRFARFQMGLKFWGEYSFSFTIPLFNVYVCVLSTQSCK